MIQPGVGIVKMFPLGRLHTARRVLTVLLLQAGQAEAAGEEADDEDPHDEMTVVPTSAWLAGWVVLEHVLTLLTRHH